MLFDDRNHAGRRLATELEHLRSEHPVVVGLPRGGVPVAAEVAHHLDVPVDVLVVRKLGVPDQPELAMGAIGEGGIRILNEAVIRAARVTAEAFATVESDEWRQLDERTRRLRGDNPPVELTGRTVIIVDDGLATGSTARAACRVARAAGARRVVLAVPVAPLGWTDVLAGEADEMIAVDTPEPFRAVGQWYRRFDATTDDEVEACLTRNRQAATPPIDEGPSRAEVTIESAGAALQGTLTQPRPDAPIVLFAHGSGSSRHSPRNREVAATLESAGIGTLLFDLLTEAESADRRTVFDIDLLARRLEAATLWLVDHRAPDAPPVGFFGASTGAAAALVAAARMGHDIGAVVSRGGRPDLAGDPALGAVRAPTLLIVGGEDTTVLDLNRRAAAKLTCPHQLVVVKGATHLFEEPGTLVAAAEEARDWFLRHLVTA